MTEREPYNGRKPELMAGSDTPPAKRLADDGRVTREVVEDLRDGVAGAFDTVYLSYKDSVHSFVARLINSSEVAEEIAQEIFVYLWEKRATIDPDQSLKRFIFVMARNRAIDHIRKHRKTQAMELPQEYADNVTSVDMAPDQSMLERELNLMLNLYLDNMPEQRRAVYRMSLEGFSNAQIAEKLGITPENVRQHLSRARRDLSALRSLVVFFLSLP